MESTNSICESIVRRISAAISLFNTTLVTGRFFENLQSEVFQQYQHEADLQVATCSVAISTLREVIVPSKKMGLSKAGAVVIRGALHC